MASSNRDRDEDTGESTDPADPPIVTERDIVFNCERCGGELVVDRDGEGLEVECSHCGSPLTIPSYRPAVAASEPPAAPPEPTPFEQRFDFTGFSADQLGRRVEELKHQLKENRSQDTELRGHVNRATMELHRLQLRLKKLQERQADIEAELSAIQDFARTEG